jgi:hypothetical protein
MWSQTAAIVMAENGFDAERRERALGNLSLGCTDECADRNQRFV